MAKADHITGGEMYYTFERSSGGQNLYKVTVKLFMRCSSQRQFPNPTTISVFDKVTNVRIRDISVPIANVEDLHLDAPDKCITNPPQVCYRVGYYIFEVLLPPSPNGYLIVSQIVFRISGITNFTSSYSNTGATYMAEIPGTSSAVGADVNNSAQFTGTDLVVVCANNSFSYSFAAKDIDGDRLRYYFCDAYQGGSFGGGNASNPPEMPPYNPVPYEGLVFNGAMPLGNKVKINEQTGMITGIAPGNGVYVVTVCVQEIRNGVIIATQRKDLQINITECSVAAASLLPEYQLCGRERSIAFTNLSNSPLINTYLWQLNSSNGETLFSSTAKAPSYTFQDTGIYNLKLFINRNKECSDSANSLVRVYPGFHPDFTMEGICFNKPTRFNDATTTVYGKVHSWYWNFGESNSSSENSVLQNPTYTYRSAGLKRIQLITTNTNGCIDTLVKSVSIVDKPPLQLAFRDTLICINDTVQLKANSSGSYQWTPVVHISNAATAFPKVSPRSTTTYFVRLDDNGCINSDSVTVRVTDRVNLQVMKDTIICQGDTIQLKVNSDGFAFQWTPAENLDNAILKQPRAITQATTAYSVTASIGGCSHTEDVRVTTVPYPQVNAGNDTTICFQTSAVLKGATNGRDVVWSPATSVSNNLALSPVAFPAITTSYILSAFDNKGCPKPAHDTVLVTVLPDIKPFAGRDTAVAIGQPLQLNAGEAFRYEWTPSFSLSATDIRNPVALFQTSSEGNRYKLRMFNEAGCVDSAYITIKVFEKGPTVFVPNAFTPNGDARNDFLKPIAVGIQQMHFFKIYNRWGQLVYQSNTVGNGWDGKINGRLQETGVFVWMFQATDFQGKAFMAKGTALLIR